MGNFSTESLWGQGLWEGDITRHTWHGPPPSRAALRAPSSSLSGSMRPPPPPTPSALERKRTPPASAHPPTRPPACTPGPLPADPRPGEGDRPKDRRVTWSTAPRGGDGQAAAAQVSPRATSGQGYFRPPAHFSFSQRCRECEHHGQLRLSGAPRPQKGHELPRQLGKTRGSGLLGFPRRPPRAGAQGRGVPHINGRQSPRPSAQGDQPASI